MRSNTSILSVIAGLIMLAAGVLGVLDTSLIGVNGYFSVNVWVSSFYLLAGLVSLGFGFYDNESEAETSMKTVGGLYVVLAIVGFFGLVGQTFDTFFGMNMATNWLHLILGIVVVVGGFAAVPSSTPIKMRHA